MDDLGVDHVDDHSDELVEHGSWPLEGELVRQSHPLRGPRVQHVGGDVLHNGDDPDEPLVPSVPILIVGLLKERLKHLVQLAVAVLTEVYVAVLGAVVEVAVHDAGLAVVADLLRAEGQTAGACEVERVLIRLLPLHAVPVRYDADAVGISRQRVCHQREQRREKGSGPSAGRPRGSRAGCRRRRDRGASGVGGVGGVGGRLAAARGVPPVDEERYCGPDPLCREDRPGVGLLGAQPLEGRLHARVVARAAGLAAAEEGPPHLFR
mmetsp:Transcript_141981/g.441458  ORF Transcript_141981/g.441458 Transcript_141981/m.441458 type:complete len:265 (+) Transcript_141981:1562-2356(+)